jgi:hypothetical protein
MDIRFLACAGCLALLVTAAAPGVLSHPENGHDYPGQDPGGVDGAYYGSAGPAVVDEDAPLGESQYEDTIATGAILCDGEIGGDGTTPFPQDEVTVNGYDTRPEGGSVPDTWDDGGIGGACHPHHYRFEPYNAPGCPGGDAHAVNVADDHVGSALVDTFIGAACDWKTTEAGLLPDCLVSQLGFTSSCVGDDPCGADGAADGVNLGSSSTSCFVGDVDSCGADSVADGVNFGHGWAGVPFPGHECTAAEAMASVFVFDAVATVGLGGPHIHPALSGQIWSG